jgi:hypothetical protein
MVSRALVMEDVEAGVVEPGAKLVVAVIMEDVQALRLVSCANDS